MGIACGMKELTGISGGGSSSYNFIWNESGAITKTEQGWIKNGTCGQYVSGIQYWIENVTLNNTEPINFLYAAL